MAKAKAEKRLSVRISASDGIELRRLQRKLLGMQESQLTRILLHYGIGHASQAVAEMLEEPEEE